MRLLLVTLTACSTASSLDRPTSPTAPVEPAALDARAVASPIDRPTSPASPVEPDELDARFVEAIRTAATGYTPWGRVDARPNLAPMLCRMPTAADHGVAAQVRRSAADDAPHGEKLYYLWASDKPTYLGLGAREVAVPIGFAIVKEAFVARRGGPPPAPVERGVLSTPGAEPPPITTLTVAGTQLSVGAPHGVYVMTKVGAGDGTDAGWIYGTVTADGTVTSAGKVASCVGCHEGAPHERLFGLQPATGVASGSRYDPRVHGAVEE